MHSRLASVQATIARRPAGLAMLALVLLLVLPPATRSAGAAEPTPPDAAGAPRPVQPATPPTSIPGFRAAHFGMAESELRQAIRKDFPAAAPRLKAAVHPVEKTTVLSLPVADLLPHSGVAQISYILGYRSKRLIQVNIVWTSDRSIESDQAVVATANSLRDYFAAQGYRPDSIIANRQLADGAILVFRAADAQGRTVLAVLIGTAAGDKAPADKSPRKPPLALELSYIADPAHPDVFRIGKGQF